ncbi:N-acetylglucosamine kinase [Streptomyces sp. CA-294286]|uniref:N-acetylglucosamine kinase n=1 Tax=Streptomyces sp. CA-294286 TaxID=3240070 RepID=UPI003D8A6966
MPLEQYVLGVDSGGSGVRFGLARAASGTPVTSPVVSALPVRTGPEGIDAGHLLEQLLPAAAELTGRVGGGAPVAVCVGAAGMATLGGGLRAGLPQALADGLGVRRLALAADAVTAYAGALGPRAGAVVAGGTGLIALGTDLRVWRRADGWGHLLGDCGGGAWIGRAGLEAALRAHDGRPGGSSALLERLEAVFGPAAGLPGLLYPRSDRPAVLASFAPEVAVCAQRDPVADGILREAARHIAGTARAACPPPDGPEARVALTGGLLKLGEPLLGPLRAEMAGQVPHARLVPAAGDPLAGALSIAAALASDTLPFPDDSHMLHVSDCQAR